MYRTGILREISAGWRYTECWGEIEARLREHAGIADLAAVLDGEEGRLIAYYTEREVWEGKQEAEKLPNTWYRRLNKLVLHQQQQGLR